MATAHTYLENMSSQGFWFFLGLWLFHPGFMVMHFHMLTCLRGQPGGLSTDLPGRIQAWYRHPTAHRINEGWPVSVTESTHASLKLIKTLVDGCYLLHGPRVHVCVLNVLYYMHTCFEVSSFWRLWAS